MVNKENFSHKEKRLLISLVMSSVLPLLDSSIINVILPKLRDEFFTSDNVIQLTVTIYFLTSAIGILISSYLQKAQGLKRVWRLSLFLFFIGSVLVGLAGNIYLLIISRAIQGLGAGLILPLAQSIVVITFGKNRAKSVMAIIAIPAVFAPALGPLLGAVLTESVSWRLAFFINIPLTIFPLWCADALISNQRNHSLRFNAVAFLLITLSFVGFFIATNLLIKSFTWLNFCYVLLAVFCLIVSLLINNKKHNKIIALAPFQNKNYTAAMILGFLVSFVFFGFLVFYPIAEGSRFSHSMITLGLLLSMQGVGAWLARKVIYLRIKDYSPFIIAGYGLLISAISIPFIELTNYYMIFLGYFIRGAGLGIATIAVLSAPFLWCAADYIQDTSTISRIIQQTGGMSGGLFAAAMTLLINMELITKSHAYLIFVLITVLAFLFALISYKYSVSRS